jgi:4-diphosphocytidyl-2-C-methyl-D-erythritol kinase
VFAGWNQRDLGPIDPALPLDRLRNDMTAAAIALQPVIADVLAALERAGEATLVRMSGSGATCLALFPDLAARDRAVAVLSQVSGSRGWWLCPTHII